MRPTLSKPAAPRVARLLLAASLGATCLVAAAGCQKALFPQKEPRTQYDRYDAVRNQQAPTYIEDEYGRRTPNLRGRLAPKK